MCYLNRNIKSIEVSADSAHLEIEEPTIYNSVSTDNQITWGQFMKYNEEAGYTVPSSRCIWYYCFRLDKNIWVHKFNILLLHLIPAIIVDGVSMAVGRKPRYEASIHCNSMELSFYIYLLFINFIFQTVESLQKSSQVQQSHHLFF